MLGEFTLGYYDTNLKSCYDTSYKRYYHKGLYLNENYLSCNDGHKSFYCKAKTLSYPSLTELVPSRTITTLISYGTPVLTEIVNNISGTRKYVRHINDYLASATTLRHIKGFSGLSKKEFLSLRYSSLYESLQDALPLIDRDVLNRYLLKTLDYGVKNDYFYKELA